MGELSTDSAAREFPPRQFSNAEITFLLLKLHNTCKTKNATWSYTGDLNKVTPGYVDQVSFFYNYYLECDSFRLAVMYNLNDTIELAKFNIKELK